VEDDLRTAVDELTRLGYPYWRALAQADLADWLEGQGRGGEAAPLREEAVATLTELRAEPALRRVRHTAAALERQAVPAAR
jgi:hypothetical protein